MVFRKDRGGDSFQKQINALRQQLGGAEFEEVDESITVDSSGAVEETYVSQRYYEPPAQYPSERQVYELPVEEPAQQAVSNEPRLPSIPSVDGETTILGPNATWKGEIVAEGSMQILGKFEGDIKVRDNLFILGDANVDATIAAGTVVVAGRYSGALNCNDRLEVLPSGRLRGEVYAPTLVVHEGAVINSRIKMTTGASAEPPVPAAVHRRSHRGTA